MDTWKKPEVHAGMWWTDRRMNAPPAPGENVTSTSYLWDEVPTCTRISRCEHGLRKEMRRHPASTPKIHFWLSFSLRQFYASLDGRTDRHCASGSVLTFLPFSNEIWHFCPSTWMLNRTCDLCCIYCQKNRWFGRGLRLGNCKQQSHCHSQQSSSWIGIRQKDIFDDCDAKCAFEH
jgi:hypothetical protein